MSTRGRSSTQTAIAIAASACSLGAIVFLGMGGLERDAQATIEHPTPAAPAALPGRTDRAAKSTDSTDSAESAESAGETPSPVSAALPPIPAPTADTKHTGEADLVTVPNVSGERLWIARKHLRDVGLVLAPRDEGRVVPTLDYGMYAVGVAPILGTRVPAGTKVEVAVEYWSPSWGRGY